MPARKTKIASIEAERVALGSVFLSSDAWPIVSEICPAAEYFSEEKHRALYAAIAFLSASKSATDIITVAEKLESDKKIDLVGGVSGLAKMADSVPSSKNVKSYARIVADRYRRRQMLAIADEMKKSASISGTDLCEISDCFQRKIQDLVVPLGDTPPARAVSDFLPETLGEIDRLFQSPGSLIGLPSGFSDLDEKMGGLQRGDMIVVAARPAMGKSAFALNIAENFAARKKRVVIYTLEMPGAHLTRRLLGGMARIDQHRLRTGWLQDSEWPEIVSAARRIEGMPIEIDESPSMTIEYIRASCREMTKKSDIDLLIVDYLQLMDSSGQDYRSLAIAEISRGIKLIAKEFNVPFIALSQLNRALENRPNKRPLMSDLRESGAIEQDADVILFIYRDEVYHPETEKEGIAEIIIAKQRNGPVGTVYLSFMKQYMRFENYKKLL